MNKIPKVVVIGGGTGVYTVLSGLKEYPVKLAAIVSMADNGGSTGTLREEFGILPPGDIRRALVALSTSNNKILSELFNYRFDKGASLQGHNLGNLLLTGLEQITGSFDKAVKEAVKILRVKGEVIPVTLHNTNLCAELENGEIIEGETNIDVPKHDANLRIRRVFLKPSVAANPEAVNAILKADAVILGPGDLYTSVLPNLAVEGIAEAIRETKAKIFYIVNVMTKYGETNSFRASDFVDVMELVVGKDVIDCAVVNTEEPPNDLLARYKEEHDEIVKYNKSDFERRSIKVLPGAFLRDGHFLRHDPEKLAKALSKAISQ